MAALSAVQTCVAAAAALDALLTRAPPARCLPLLCSALERYGQDGLQPLLQPLQVLYAAHKHSAGCRSQNPHSEAPIRVLLSSTPSLGRFLNSARVAF